MLSVDNITVSFSGTDLFTDVSFLINARERIGLVGKNGAGKSTILKIINGQQIPTRGGVSKTSDCTIGYLPQTMRVFDDTDLVSECGKAFEEFVALEKEMEELTHQVTVRTDYESDEYEKLLIRLNEASEYYHTHGGDEREGQIERTLLGLGFRREDFNKPTSTFSGGWRMRIELAKLLLRKPSLFLLDEPTNHLDIESIQWLEEYLQNFSGGVVLISHDKAFLDNVTNRTIELTLGRAVDYKTNYSHYVVLRAERRAQQQAAYENQQKMIEKTEDFIERFRYKPTKSNQVQSRQKQLDKLERLEVEEEDVHAMNIRFPSAPRSGQVVVEAKEAGHSFGEKHVFSGATFNVERGQKIALVGRNGEGKTTFVRAMLHEITPTEGEVKMGYNVHVGYFAQNQDDLMDGDFTVYDTLDRVAVGDIRTRLRDILGAFLFRGEDIDKKVKVLSGGERSRLAMARLMLEPYNLLVLDEPTNHMDMISKEILKLALQQYDGTVIVISHDREFLDGLVDTVYEFRDGRVKEYLGGIYDFITARKIENISDIERKNVVAAPTVEKKAEIAAAKTASKTASKQKAQQVKKPKNAFKIKELEGQIEQLESTIKALDAKLADPAQYSVELFNEWDAAKKELDSKLEEWTEESE
ncbi:MAG: ABC-F family ATP-binding cassette domain-containing protein [Mucinivorans sp.]